MSDKMMSESAINQFIIFITKRYFSLKPRFCQLILSGLTESEILGNFLKMFFLFKTDKALMQHLSQQFLMQYRMQLPCRLYDLFTMLMASMDRNVT